MGFYVTTENPNVMIRENHNTKSSEYVFICQDDLYIASTTPEEILNMLKGKYKINIYLQGKYPHDLVEEIFVKSRNIWNSYMKNLNMLFNNKLPTYLYTTFQIMKLLIRKGNLNLIHNKITYQHYTSNYMNSFITYISTSLYTKKKKK